MDRSRNAEPERLRTAPAPAPRKHSVPGSGSGPKVNVPIVLAPAPTPGKMAPSCGGPDSGSKYLDSGNFCMAPLLTHDLGKHADSSSD